jgi:hypothetical protein
MDEIGQAVSPHCGEMIEVEIDPTAGRRPVFIPDCWGCYRSIQFEVTFDLAGQAEVTAQPA